MEITLYCIVLFKGKLHLLFLFSFFLSDLARMRGICMRLASQVFGQLGWIGATGLDRHSDRQAKEPI